MFDMNVLYSTHSNKQTKLKISDFNVIVILHSKALNLRVAK